MFNQDVIAAVKAAKFCRVVVYPAVRGGSERVLLEMTDELSLLGYTYCLRGAGHWLVIDLTPQQVAEEAGRLRGVPVKVLISRMRKGDSRAGKGYSLPIDIPRA